MVKGISRRVVVVKAPVGSIFDEAIFIIRDDVPSSSEVDAEKILREACAAADEYVRANCRPKARFMRKGIFLAILAVCSLLSLAAIITIITIK